MGRSGAVLGLRPEHKLLLHCARTATNSQRAAEIVTLIGEGIHWDRLLHIALRHRLMPLLYWQLNATCPEAVPRPFLDRLHELYQANAQRNLSLTVELLKLLNCFDVHGVSVIPYKGPALAAAIYGDLTLRPFDDLDILVHREDVPRAKELLISLGYQPYLRLTHAQEAAFLQSHCEELFVRDNNRGFIDLHWATTPTSLSCSLDAERLWARLERISLGGATISTLSPEDLLLILCEHGAKHAWDRVSWIGDIPELICRERPLDWPWILEQARTLGSRRMLFLGLFLASDVLGAPLPEAILPRVQADRVVKSLATQVRKQLFLDPSPLVGVLKRTIFYLRAMEGFTERGRYCLAQVMTSTPGDWALLPLPGPLFPVYYVLRPIRLIAKYGRILLRCF
jgi:Uncharacterised nucleotidyltransferase